MTAFAHPMKGVGDFYAGMLHPVVTIESVLPLIAFSLLAGQQRRETSVYLLATFPVALIVGALLASLRDVPAYLGVVQLTSDSVVSASLVALARRVPSWLLIALGAVLGHLRGVGQCR